MSKKILLFIGLFILLPMNAKAALCENKDMIAYQEQAKNISVTYEYEETDDDIIFNIKFSNVPMQFTVFDVDAFQNYFYKGDGEDFTYVDAFGIQSYIPVESEFVIPNVEKNKSYKFQIFVNDWSCRYNIMYTHYITIPPYNKYYKDSLCKGIEDYKLCNKWVNVSRYTYDEWKDEVNKYINKKRIIPKEEEPEEIKGIFDYVIDFYLDYYYFILPIIIVLCIAGIVLYNKKHDLF